MTTYTWPDTRSMRPRGLSFYPQHNTRRAQSTLNGATQVVSLPGARWLASMDFPDQRRAERAQLVALINRLAGGEHRLALWDIDRPRPRGDINLTGITASAAAQFATSLTLNNVYGRNQLRYTAQFGQAWWTKTRASVTLDAAVAPDGTTTAEKLVEDTQTGPHHLSRGGFAYTAGQLYTLSIHAKAAERTGVAVQLGNSIAFSSNPSVRVNLATGTHESSSAGVLSYSIKDAGAGWWRISVSGIPASTTADSVFPAFISNSGSTSYAGDGVSGIYVWGAQLDVGTLTDYSPNATLLAGDRIGVPISTGSGSQLLEVAADCTATDAGVMTVPLHTQLRGSVTGGAAVTLDKPTALFIPASGDGVAWPSGPGGICPAVAFDLLEVFS